MRTTRKTQHAHAAPTTHAAATAGRRPSINQAVDFAERVGWTFFQVEIGLGALDWLSKGVNLSFLHVLYGSLGAAAAATIKVLIAQRIGKSNDGALPSPIAPPPK